MYTINICTINTACIPEIKSVFRLPPYLMKCYASMTASMPMLRLEMFFVQVSRVLTCSGHSGSDSLQSQPVIVYDLLTCRSGFTEAEKSTASVDDLFDFPDQSLLRARDVLRWRCCSQRLLRPQGLTSESISGHTSTYDTQIPVVRNRACQWWSVLMVPQNDGRLLGTMLDGEFGSFSVVNWSAAALTENDSANLLCDDGAPGSGFERI